MALTFISAPATLAHTGNEMRVVIDTNLPPSTPNLEVKLGLLVERVYMSGTYTIPNEIPELYAVPDANGRATFFIEQYLLDQFMDQLDIPPVGGNVPVRCDHMVRRYKMYAVELSGSPQAPTAFLTTGSLVSVRHAVRGGIPRQNFNLRSYWGSTGWAVLNLGNPYLDNRGRSIRTGRDQEQWLYFAYQDVNGQLPLLHCELLVRTYFVNGAPSEAHQFMFTVNAHEVWMIPVGYLALGMQAFEPANPAVRYEVTVQAMVLSNYISVTETKTLRVDHLFYENATEIQYLNGLGTFTQLLLRGRLERETDVTTSDAEAYHEKGMASYLGQTRRYDTTVRDGVNHASGGLTEAELKQMRELLAAKKVMVKDARLGWVPVRVLNRKLAQDRLETARTVELQYVPDWENGVVDMF